jgi:hypothetical protein
VAAIEPAAAAATTDHSSRSDLGPDTSHEAEATDAFELQAALEPQMPEKPVATRGKRSALNYVLAASLLGISAPFLANAIYAGATQHSCVGRYDPQGRCSERVTLGPLFFVSLGVGLLAAGSGSAFLIFKPLGERDTTHDTNPEAARLRSSQRF